MKQKIQLILIIAIIIAAIRVAWIFYERHQESAVSKKQEAPALDPDFYVHPKKIFPYDLKSAKAEITKQPSWVKVGYAYGYFPYSAQSRHADLAHEAGKLSPLQKLDIKDLVTGMSPKDASQKQLLAVFDDAGKWYATPIGTEKDGFYNFWVNDMLFLEDPHQLYKHWPADVWQAIDQHQAKPGMNEFQADFALGIGLLDPGSDSTDRTLNYPNGGKPVKIRFHNGKAIEVKSGAQLSK
jgi:hypothetical protein